MIVNMDKILDTSYDFWYNSSAWLIQVDIEMTQFTSHKPSLTVPQVAKLIEEGIWKGEYPVGARLPTVRDLAEQLGVNQNTTVRAYRALKHKGYLELVRGRGAFVRAKSPTPTATEGQWLTQLEQLMEQAKAQSLSRAQLMSRFSQTLDRVFGENGRDLRLAFVECNQPDVAMLAEQIGMTIGRHLEGILLSEFLERSEELVQRFDLIVTTFYHLSEVSWLIRQDPRQKIVGVHALPSHDTLLNIARLQAPVIGLVCSHSSTVDHLVHIIQSYHPAATIIPSLIDDEARVQTLLDKADAIVVTRVVHQRLVELEPRAPVIMVTFTIEEQSIEFLRGRIWELQAAQVKAT